MPAAVRLTGLTIASATLPESEAAPTVEQLENSDVSFVTWSVAVAVTPSPFTSPPICALHGPGETLTNVTKVWPAPDANGASQVGLTKSSTKTGFGLKLVKVPETVPPEIDVITGAGMLSFASCSSIPRLPLSKIEFATIRLPVAVTESVLPIRTPSSVAWATVLPGPIWFPTEPETTMPSVFEPVGTPLRSTPMKFPAAIVPDESSSMSIALPMPEITLPSSGCGWTSVKRPPGPVLTPITVPVESDTKMPLLCPDVGFPLGRKPRRFP